MVTMVILRWLLVASFLWEVSSVCVWQGGGGFRLACGFRQSGLFRIRSIGGLKGWAGAGFTIGDEDGFKDSLTNQEGNKGPQPQVQPAQQSQYLGQYSNPKVRVVKAPSHYNPAYNSANSIPNQIMSTNNPPQHLHLVPGHQVLPSVPSLNVVPPSLETPGPSRAGLQKRSSLWDRMKQLSPINLLPGRKKRLKNSALSPSANPNNFNNYRAQDGSRIVPMPFPGGLPQPQPPQFDQFDPPVRKKGKKTHYAGRVVKTSEVADDELYEANDSGVPAFKPIPHYNLPEGVSVEKRVLTEEDYTIEEEPSTKRPKKKKKAKSKRKKISDEEKPYGLKLLENSENYGKKFHIEPSPRPEKNEEEIIVEEEEQQAETPVSEKVEGYKYDNNIFPDIYFTTTSTSSTEGLKRMLDVESTTKKGKLKKIKLIRNRKKKNGTSMNIPILSMSTPIDDLEHLEETSPTTTTTFQTSTTPRLILSTKRPKASPTKTSFKANVDFGENLFSKDERGHVSPSDFLEELKKFNEKVIENAHAKREEFMRTSSTTTPSTTTKAPNVLKDLPNLYEYYDPRYPPDHEVNRKKIEELVKENDSTRPTTPTPPSFFTRNDYYNPKTHFSRAPVVKPPDSSFIKLDSVESQTLINKTKTYNDKFYSHFNRTATEVSPTESLNYFDFYAQQSGNTTTTTTTTKRPELPEIELPWEKKGAFPTIGAALNTGRPAEVNQHGNTWNVPEPPELPTNELMKKQLEFDDGPRGNRYWNNYRNSPDVDFVTNDNFKNYRMDNMEIDVVKSPEVLEIDFDSREGPNREQRVVEEVAESVKSVLFAPSDRAAEPGSFRSNSEVDAWNSGNFYNQERRKKIKANLRTVESDDSANNGFMSGSERAMDKLEDQIKKLTKDSFISSEEISKKPEPALTKKKIIKVLRKKPEPPKVEEKEEEEEEEEDEEDDAKDDEESEDEETTTKKKSLTTEVGKKRGKPRYRNRMRGKQVPLGSMAPPLPPAGQPAQSQFFSDSPQQSFIPPISSMGGKEPDFGASSYNNFQPYVLPPQNSFQNFQGPMRMIGPSAMPPMKPNPNLIRRPKVQQKKGGFFRNIFGGNGGKGAKVKSKHRFQNQGPTMASGPHPSFIGPSADPLLLPPAPPPGNNFMNPNMANFYQFQQQASNAYGTNNFFQQQALAHHMQNLKMNAFNSNNPGLRGPPTSTRPEISITKLTVKPKWNKLRGRDQERVIEEEFLDEDEEESEKVLIAKPKPKTKLRPIQRPRPTDSDLYETVPKKRIDPEKASILHALKVLTKARTDSIESVVSEHYGIKSKNSLIRERIKVTTTTTVKPPTLADLTAKLTPLLNLAQESLGRPFQRFHSNNNNNYNNEERERDRIPGYSSQVLVRRPLNQNPPSRIHKDNLDLESNPNLVISVPDFNDKGMRVDRNRHRDYQDTPSFSTDDIASLLSKPDSRERPPPPQRRPQQYGNERRQEERRQDSQVLSDDFLRSQMSLFLDKEISKALEGPTSKPGLIIAKPTTPIEMQNPFLDKTDFAKRVGYLAGNINNALATPEIKHHNMNMNNITDGQLNALKKLLILDKLEQNIDRFESSSNPHHSHPQRPIFVAMPKNTPPQPAPTASSHPETTFFPMPMKTPPPTFASEWIPKTTLATLLQSFVNHSVAPTMPSSFPSFQTNPSLSVSPTSPSLLSNTMLTPNARAILALKAFALKRAQTSKPDPRIGLANPTQQSNAITSSINPTFSTYTPHGIDLTSILNPNPSPFPSQSSWTSRSVMLDVKNAPKSFYPANASVTFDTEKNIVSDFTCEEQQFFPGLYADMNLSCKVFHLCAKTEKGYIKKTFRCPKETVFDQEVLKCNWNLYVECKESKEKYHFNKYLSQSFQFLRILGEFSASYQKPNGTTTG